MLVLIPIPATKTAITITWVERATRPAPWAPSIRATVMLVRPKAANDAISPAEASSAPIPRSRAGTRGPGSRGSAMVTDSGVNGEPLARPDVTERDPAAAPESDAPRTGRQIARNLERHDSTRWKRPATEGRAAREAGQLDQCSGRRAILQREPARPEFERG